MHNLESSFLNIWMENIRVIDVEEYMDPLPNYVKQTEAMLEEMEAMVGVSRSAILQLVLKVNLFVTWTTRSLNIWGEQNILFSINLLALCSAPKQKYIRIYGFLEERALALIEFQ